MQLDDQYIDKPDDFSRKAGEKLRNHRMPVDPDVWNTLKDKLPRERRISAHWPWAAAGVVALALVWLFLPDPPADDPLLTEHSQLEKPIKPEVVVPEMNAEGTESRTERKANIKQVVKENGAKPEKTEEPVETSGSEKAAKPGETAGSEEITKPGEIVTQEKNLALEETAGLAKAVKPEERPNPEEPSEPKGISKHSDRIQQEQRGLQSLMAALGSGGLPLDFSFGNYDANNPSYSDTFPGGGGELNNGDGAGSGGQYNILKPSDYSDITHRPPVSFSLTVDFPIGKAVSMETGLSYTYLFSRFRRNDDFIYRGTLRQHYIGIPVNLRYTVWQNDDWNIYILGGGSMEKGLRSVYKQEIEHNGGIVDHSNVYSGIRGFQFSAQGGAGFSYRLQGNLSLFGEPRVVYYFRNNQPMSARTENPLIFGLNMGIRIQFK